MAVAFMKFYSGSLKLVAEGGKVVECSYCKGKVSRERPTVESGKDEKVLLKAKDEITEYLLGKRKKFTVPIKLKGTAFQKKVWEKLREVPYGSTCSYSDLAREAGSPRASRAVGQANGANRLLLLVPCHRVIQADGRLGGFGCGINVKKFLLGLESGSNKPSQRPKQSN